MSIKKAVCLSWIVFIFTVFYTVDDVRAENTNRMIATIIFDFTETIENTGPIAYVFFGTDINQVIKNTGGEPDEIITNKSQDAIIRFLENLNSMYPQKTGNRWISEKGYALDVYVFYYETTSKPVVPFGAVPMPAAGPAVNLLVVPLREVNLAEVALPEVTFQETNRKSRLVEDLSTLSKIALKIIDLDKARPDVNIYKTTYQLEKKRALLTITVKLNENLSKKIEILTGGPEHWFLSADLLVDNINDVQYKNGKPDSIEPRETPKEFYLGINVAMFGDILSENMGTIPPFKNIYKNLHLKGMMLISKNPLDSFGFGLGLRLPKFELFGKQMDFTGISIFTSYVWTWENVEIEETGIKRIQKAQLLFGISYNLDKALGWLQ